MNPHSPPSVVSYQPSPRRTKRSHPLRILAALFLGLLATFIIMFGGNSVSRPINQQILHLGWFSDYLTSTYTFAPPSVTHQFHPLSLALHLLTLAAAWCATVYLLHSIRPK